MAVWKVLYLVKLPGPVLDSGIPAVQHGAPILPLLHDTGL